MPNNFTYTTGLPNVNNNPSVDAPNMTVNTNSISSLIGIDHVGFNTNGSGVHKQVTFFQNISSPSLGDGISVLATNNPISATWPTWKNGNAITYQMIGANANSDASTASFSGFGAFGTVTANYQQSAGWTYLPGGMMLQYGSVTSTLGTPQISPSTINVTFPVTYSTSNIVVTITPICKSGGTSQVHVASVQQGTVATNGFTCNFDSSTTSYIGFTWTAIGK